MPRLTLAAASLTVFMSAAAGTEAAAQDCGSFSGTIDYSDSSTRSYVGQYASFAIIDEDYFGLDMRTLGQGDTILAVGMSRMGPRGLPRTGTYRAVRLGAADEQRGTALTVGHSLIPAGPLDPDNLLGYDAVSGSVEFTSVTSEVVEGTLAVALEGHYGLRGRSARLSIRFRATADHDSTCHNAARAGGLYPPARVAAAASSGATLDPQREPVETVRTGGSSIGAFHIQRNTDAFEDTDESWVANLGIGGPDVNELTLAWRCVGADRMRVVLVHKFLGGNRYDEVEVRYRIDEGEPTRPVRWGLTPTSKASLMPERDVAAFTRAVRSAQRVRFRVTDPLDGEQLDGEFSMEGVNEALALLPCSRVERN